MTNLAGSSITLKNVLSVDIGYSYFSENNGIEFSDIVIYQCDTINIVGNRFQNGLAGFLSLYHTNNLKIEDNSFESNQKRPAVSSF